jgi:hypothetical protein
MRAFVFESLGVWIVKPFQTSNPYNMIRATFDALTGPVRNRFLQRRGKNKLLICWAAAVLQKRKQRRKGSRNGVIRWQK